MLPATVLLPEGLGERPASISASASVDRAKGALVKEFSLGSPADFVLAYRDASGAASAFPVTFVKLATANSAMREAKEAGTPLPLALLLAAPAVDPRKARAQSRTFTVGGTSPLAEGRASRGSTPPVEKKAKRTRTPPDGLRSSKSHSPRSPSTAAKGSSSILAALSPKSSRRKKSAKASSRLSRSSPLSSPSRGESNEIAALSPMLNRRAGGNTMSAMMSQMQKAELKGSADDDFALLDRSCAGFRFESGSRLIRPNDVNPQFEFAAQENVFAMHYMVPSVEHFVGHSPAFDGPFVLSYVESDSGTNPHGRTPHARLLVRTKLGSDEHSVPHWSEAAGSEGGRKKNKHSFKHLLSQYAPKVSSKSVVAVPISANEKLGRTLQKFHQSQLVPAYKFGVILVKDGQVEENEIMCNKESTPAFDRFLDLIGTRVTLSGFEGFRGGLDTRGDNTTGEVSVHTVFRECEIMFHVATMLPFTPDDPQQIAKKRHIGNDIVVVVFKEGDTPFPPSIITSNFNHIFVVVSEDPETPGNYVMAVASKDGVGKFGPALPSPCTFPASKLRDVLLCKLINAEWAAYRSPEFDHKNRRTRTMLLEDMVGDYVKKD